MEHFETNLGKYTITTDRSKLDLDLIHQFLSEQAYWAVGRSKDIVSKSIDHSACFGIYTQNGSQVGFARVVTDLSTFAWICDLFILEPHRGQGLGKWLIRTIVDFYKSKQLKRQLLATRDAHRLYSEYGGFMPLKSPDSWMELVVDRY
jgi:GNAT superfamily N-acetyltransferase